MDAVAIADSLMDLEEKHEALKAKMQEKSTQINTLNSQLKQQAKKLKELTQKRECIAVLKTEDERNKVMLKEAIKHLDYALAYGPECAVDNPLHAGCRDRALEFLKALKATAR